MIVISNNIQGRMDIPDNAVIRINMAWIKDTKELESLLKENVYKSIFLDCPQGRNKPPKPVFMLEEAITLANKYYNVKYLAISNVEDAKKFGSLRFDLRPGVKLVPKIETEKGVRNIVTIMEEGQTNVAMLDKEDLYTDVKQDAEKYVELVNYSREQCKKHKLTLIELEGVIFMQHDKGE